MNDELSKYRVVYAVAADGVSDGGHQLYTIHQEQVPNADNWRLFVCQPAEQPKAATDAQVVAMGDLLDRLAKDSYAESYAGYEDRRNDISRLRAALAEPRPMGSVPEGLLDRVRSAEQRIADGHSIRRVPADPSDPDLVLAEVRMYLEGKPRPFWVDAAPEVQP